MLGKWVNDGAGASKGEISEAEVRVPLDPRSGTWLKKDYPTQTTRTDDLSGPTGDVVDSS